MTEWIFELSEEQRKRAEWLANFRGVLKARRKMADKQVITVRDKINFELLSICGEILVADIFGEEVNEEAWIKTPGVHFKNFGGRRGLSLVVKTRFPRGNKLVFAKHQFPPKAKVIVALAQTHEGQYRFRFSGWMTREDAVKHSYIMDLGSGPQTVVDEAFLKEMEDGLPRYL